VRGQLLGRTLTLPGCSSTLYNVFARNDPVAYRLVPTQRLEPSSSAVWCVV
jgi:hypothetical protein